LPRKIRRTQVEAIAEMGGLFFCQQRDIYYSYLFREDKNFSELASRHLTGNIGLYQGLARLMHNVQPVSFSKPFLAENARKENDGI
jgi:hypothetical protein